MAEQLIASIKAALPLEMHGEFCDLAFRAHRSPVNPLISNDMISPDAAMMESRPRTPMTENNATGAIKSRPAAPMVPSPSRADINVRRIRLASRGIGTTQRTFAAAIGVPLKTVSNWEQGRRKPTGPALVLLTLIERDPWIVFDVVNDQHRRAT